MKINKWLIHKLGGFAKEDILPLPIYTIENPKVEKLWVYTVDRYGEIPEKVILEKLAYDFVPEIKSQMKVTKKYGHNGEISYRAEILIVSKKKNKLNTLGESLGCFYYLIIV